MANPTLYRLPAAWGYAISPAAAKYPHRDEVERILETLIANAAECRREDGSYSVSWETEYGEAGELKMDPVADLNGLLPAGWSAAWTGSGDGAEEDFTIDYSPRSPRRRAGQ